MSEEMKALIALLDHLGLEIRCTGNGADNDLVAEECFELANPEFTYTVQVKP